MTVSPPLVLIDATAVPADRRGVGRYVDGLIGAYEGPLAIACQERDAAYYRQLSPAATVLPQRGIEAVWRRLLWEQFALPGVARRAGARVIHSPHYTLPLLSTRARVVTFHDATFFSDPGVHSRGKRAFFRAWIRVSAALARGILVPSRATADELARFVTRRRGYTVAHHGVDPAVFHPADTAQREAAAAALGLDRPWIAFLGTIEPRKNVPALIAAYADLVRGWKDAAPVPLLALAGGPGWERDLAPDIAAVPEPGEVRRLGYIDLELASGYLGGAVLVVYPSSGEGFGLPVLEGMACGATVLTTPRLALPEIGGDAVAYTEPDPEPLAEALRGLLHDPAERSRLARLGVDRAAGFTWTACARIHAAAFASALR